MLRHDVFYFACCHHISEIMLRHVSECAWPATNSPNVPIFKRLKDDWHKINTSMYDIGVNDEKIKNILNEDKNNILNFIEDEFTVKITSIFFH